MTKPIIEGIPRPLEKIPDSIPPNSYFTGKTILENIFIASKEDPKNALKMWENWVKWYFDYQPLAITPDQITELQNSGLAQIIGTDRQGRASVVIKSSRINIKTIKLEIAMKYACNTFERALKISAENGQSQIIVIYDRKDFSIGITQIPTLTGLANDIAKLIQSNYPERMYKSYV